MDQWIGHTAFITGASSGIGRSIAEKLVVQGLKVVGFARRKERLEEIAENLSSESGKFYPYAGDVTKEADIIKAFEWTKEKVGPVSILVNNAGVIRPARLSESSTSNWIDILNINVLAVAIATREAIKHMNENNIGGHVININSIAGHKTIVSPLLNLYPASKHALTAFTENLRLELGSIGSKIKVTSISPGMVDTEMTAVDRHNLNQEMYDKFLSFPRLQSPDLADSVMFVLSTPKYVNISELTIQAVGEQF